MTIVLTDRFLISRKKVYLGRLKFDIKLLQKELMSASGRRLEELRRSLAAKKAEVSDIEQELRLLEGGGPDAEERS